MKAPAAPAAPVPAPVPARSPARSLARYRKLVGKAAASPTGSYSLQETLTMLADAIARKLAIDSARIRDLSVTNGLRTGRVWVDAEQQSAVTHVTRLTGQLAPIDNLYVDGWQRLKPGRAVNPEPNLRSLNASAQTLRAKEAREWRTVAATPVHRPAFAVERVAGGMDGRVTRTVRLDPVGTREWQAIGDNVSADRRAATKRDYPAYKSDPDLPADSRKPKEKEADAILQSRLNFRKTMAEMHIATSHQDYAND